MSVTLLKIWRKQGAAGFAVADLEISRAADVPAGYDQMAAFSLPAAQADAVLAGPAQKTAALKVFRWVADGRDLPSGFSSGLPEVDAIVGPIDTAAQGCRGM